MFGIRLCFKKDFCIIRTSKNIQWSTIDNNQSPNLLRRSPPNHNKVWFIDLHSVTEMNLNLIRYFMSAGNDCRWSF